MPVLSWPLRYRADTNGILLVDVLFTVKATQTGAITCALSLVPASLSLWPSWSAPYFQFNNFNGASNSAGALNIAPVTTVGMWAWADSYDLFNTATLNRQQVSTALRGILVRRYGSSSGAAGDVLSGCSVPASSARAATVAIDALRRVCAVNLNGVNDVPAKQLAVTLVIPDGASADQTAQVSMPAHQGRAMAVHEPIPGLSVAATMR